MIRLRVLRIACVAACEPKLSEIFGCPIHFQLRVAKVGCTIANSIAVLTRRTEIETCFLNATKI